LAGPQRYFSDVFWHFPGSPDFPEGFWPKKPQDIFAKGLAPKEPSEGVAIVEKIAESGRLLATCSDPITNNWSTNKFCCVTDIPMKDLPHHAAFYGKVAIGFRALAVHGGGFLPVQYVPEQFLPHLEELVPAPLDPAMMKTVYEFDELEWGSGSANDRAMRGIFNQARRKAEEEGTVEKRVDEGAIGANSLADYLKITDFSVNPADTFYAEREWRRVGDFVFEKENVAAVAAPEEHLGAVREALFDRLGYPATLSVIAWEFVEGA
jgi:hypothetical protein